MDRHAIRYLIRFDAFNASARPCASSTWRTNGFRSYSPTRIKLQRFLSSSVSFDAVVTETDFEDMRASSVSSFSTFSKTDDASSSPVTISQSPSAA